MQEEQGELLPEDVEYLLQRAERALTELAWGLPNEKMKPSPKSPNNSAPPQKEILCQNEIELLLKEMAVGVDYKTDYRRKFNRLIRKAFFVLEKEIDHTQYETVVRDAPHDIPKLPDGKMVVYAFLYNDRFLKIGKVGQNSKPRYSNYQYNPIRLGTLAASLLADEEMCRCCKIDKSNVKEWIMQNCTRIDVIVDAELGGLALGLIESVLLYYYEPKYE